MPVAPALTVAELTLLFTGDEDSAGCPSARLVEAICARLRKKPKSERDLVTVIYGTDVDPEWLTNTPAAWAITAGFNRWKGTR